MNMISVNNLHKEFNQKKVLRGVSFEAKEGEILGILGPSGSGKTTMIKIVIGHLKSDKGISEIFNIESDKLTEEVYSNIGTVLDKSGLLDRLTCRQNLEVFRRIYSISKSEVDKVLYKVGLYESSNTVVDELSNGMKQRLVLARAIMHSPKLLFLDEPTSGLDPSTSKLIHELLLELKDKGSTILLVTHNMEEATYLCDKVAFLFNGKIIEYDSPKEICNKYNKLNKINIITKDNDKLSFTNEKNNYYKIEDIFKKSEIKSIHSTEPTLGDVFISLTGKELI